MRILQNLLSILIILVICSRFISAQQNGDYQTAKSGNWNDPSVWQVYNNGSWNVASQYPDTTAGKVTVLSGHAITVTENIIIDSVYVDNGGSIVVNSGVTMTVNYNNNKPGLVLQGLNALIVNGTLRNEGNIIGAKAPRNVDFSPEADTAIFKDGSTYIHARDGGDPIIAKWETGSTYMITGVVKSYPKSQPQNFYNFVWNCPNQTRGDGSIRFYRNRVRGDIIIYDNGSQTGGDRDIRLTEASVWPKAEDNITPLQDTIWIDGNITLIKPEIPGHWSRLASTGSSSGINAVIIVGGNITVGDSCVFGRSGSNSDVRWIIGGDLSVSSGGTIRNVGGNGYRMKAFVFNKQGIAKLSIAEGKGNSNYGSTLVGEPCFQVMKGCTLDIGTSKIDSTIGGFFVIDNGGAVKVTYGQNSGLISPRGESGIIDTEHDSIGVKPTPNGNSFIIAKNVIGSGTITFSASEVKNVSDPAKAILRQWIVTPSPGIKSGDLEISISPYDIPQKANWKNFVAMKYGGVGTNWINRGPVNFVIDQLWQDTLSIKGATLKNVTDLGGIWSLGDLSLTKEEVINETDWVMWPNTEASGYWLPINNGNVVGDTIRFAALENLMGNAAEPLGGTYLYREGSWGNNAVADPDSSQRHPRIGWRSDAIYPGQTAPGWPANTTDTLNNVWVQFKVSPIKGYMFNVNSVSFDICGAGTGDMKAKAYVSTDPSFKNKIEIFSSERLGSYVFNYVKVTGLNINLKEGESFYLRIYPWLDNQTKPVTGKRVIIKRIIIGGKSEPATSLTTELSNLPKGFKLYNAYPNPFNPVTNIKFDLPTPSNVTLKVFNILGQEVTTLLSEFKDAGTYIVPFNAINLSSGVYIYKIQAGSFTETKRMLLLK